MQRSVRSSKVWDTKVSLSREVGMAGKSIKKKRKGKVKKRKAKRRKEKVGW